MMRKLWLPLAFVAGLGVSGANATVVYVLGDGNNDCGKGGFSACELDGSPSIIRFGADLKVSDINTLFPSVTGSEFTFDNFQYKDKSLIGLSWTYVTGLNDPGVTKVVVKAGNNWAYTSAITVTQTLMGYIFTGSLNTKDANLTNKDLIPQGISHITFFDSFIEPPPPSVVPLPAAGFGLLAALGSLLALRRRKRD